MKINNPNNYIFEIFKKYDELKFIHIQRTFGVFTKDELILHHVDNEDMINIEKYFNIHKMLERIDLVNYGFSFHKLNLTDIESNPNKIVLCAHFITPYYR